MQIFPLYKRHKKKAVALFKILFPITKAFITWKMIKYFQKKGFMKTVGIVKSKKLFGLAALSSLIFFGNKILYIHALVIDPKKQKSGLGSLLLENIQEKAQQNGQKLLILLSNPFRTQAHKFYQKNGFKRVFWCFFWKRVG